MTMKINCDKCGIPLEEHTCYWEKCTGCSKGHSSFHKTVVESPQWKAWQEEQRKRFSVMVKTGKAEGVFDIDESQECGWLGEKHFQEFIKFIVKSR